jgi:hypothetical protein
VNDIVLYIFSEKGDQDLQYTFVLEERDRLPIIGTRTVPIDKWDRVVDCYPRIQETVNTFMQKIGLPNVTDEEATMYENTYKSKVGDIVEAISDLLMTHFWPEDDEQDNNAFASRFVRLVQESIHEGSYSHLLLATNDSKIPWWLACPGPTAQKPMLCESFALGMISLRTNQPQPKRSNPPVDIRIITCPTLDLAENEHISEVQLDPKIRQDLQGVARCVLLSGRHKQPPLGLDKDQVKKGFKEGRLILYHGHFNLTGGHEVSGSSISASGNPLNRSTPAEISIRSLDTDQSLNHKDIIFIGCATAGMHPNIDETLGEYLAKRGSTLVGTLYPILDDQARLFANELSKALFLNHFSWGEAVRWAREAAKMDNSVFYRAAYCYFGIPWQTSPVFGARMDLHIRVPTYLKSVYELVAPDRVYSSIVRLEFVPSTNLTIERFLEENNPEEGNPCSVIAALPSVFVAELFQRSNDYIVLGPMVASVGDVRIVATDVNVDFTQPVTWLGKRVVFKGAHLTASAFLEVLLNKWQIPMSQDQRKTIPTDCAAVIGEGLADIGLVVAREDLSSDEGFPGNSDPFSVDTALANFYDGVPIPRILWVTRRDCMNDWRRYYIEEFFKRLNERISLEKQVQTENFPASGLDGKPSEVRLYRIDDKAERLRAKEALTRFLKDWAELDEKKRKPIPEEGFYDWPEPEKKPQP